MFTCQKKYFSIKEYLLGDSVFLASMVMVPAFKKGPNATLSEEHKSFNIKHAKVQIQSENCNGLLKARFKCVKKRR